MTERDLHANEALAGVGVKWDDPRTERNLAAAHRKLRRNRAGRRLAAALAVSVAAVVLVVLGGRGLRSTGDGVPTPQAAASATPKRIVFRDGSAVELLGERSELQVESVSRSRIEVVLRQGSGRFRVAQEPTRTFLVRAGAVTVEVLGTDFLVERRGAQTWVEVFEGEVLVTWAGGNVRLHHGGQGLFPLPGSPASPAPDDSTAPAAAHPSAAPSVHARSLAEQFRLSAAQGEYAEAYALMTRSPSAVSGSAADLMLAADVARRAGHPGEATVYLERVVQQFPKSSQAPLASFTLGRIYMSTGRTKQAQAAFARAGLHGDDSPLAEDALARQVEAARRAGDQARARRLAQQYLTKYPQGKRRAAVKRHGGIE